MRFLRIGLRLWGRLGGRRRRMNTGPLHMGPACRVRNHGLLRRVRPCGNNTFDSVAAGTSRQDCCENEQCNDAHHDAVPGMRCATNADKIRRAWCGFSRCRLCFSKVPHRSRTLLTLPDPDRCLRSSARCGLRLFRARNVFIFDAGEVVPGGVCRMHRAVGQLAAGHCQGNRQGEVAASNTRLGNAFMSALAYLAALLELSWHGQGCSAVLTDAVGPFHLTARE